MRRSTTRFSKASETIYYDRTSRRVGKRHRIGQVEDIDRAEPTSARELLRRLLTLFDDEELRISGGRQRFSAGFLTFLA